MQREHPIDELIRREKETEPNPFLVTHVMAKIEGAKKMRRSTPLWQSLTLAAGMAAVVFLGISIGNSYVENGTTAVALNINDRQIENLGYYNFGDDEQGQ
jgi:type VI protein secretion system component VasF